MCKQVFVIVHLKESKICNNKVIETPLFFIIIMIIAFLKQIFGGWGTKFEMTKFIFELN